MLSVLAARNRDIATSEDALSEAFLAAVRTPLMLETVLGLDAAQIGAAFLVAPSTMGQRLVRAKARIKDAGLRFQLPAAEDMPERLGDVLNAVYAAYGTSWDAVAGACTGPHDLAEEACSWAACSWPCCLPSPRRAACWP